MFLSPKNEALTAFLICESLWIKASANVNEVSDSVLKPFLVNSQQLSMIIF